MSSSISPIALSGIRVTGAALLFFLFSYFLPSSMQTRQRIERADWWKMLVCSILIISGNQGLFILGIGLTNPVDSSVMSSMTPLLTMLLAAIFLRFPMTWMKVTGVATGLAGVIMLIAGTPTNEVSPNPLLGNLLCLTAQLFAAIYYISFSGIINKYSPYSLMKWLFLLSLITYVPFCLPEIMRIDFASVSMRVWLDITYMIVVATFFAYLMIPIAQRSLKPTVVSMYSYLQPVFAAIAAVALGISDFGWLKIAATILIFGGIYLVNRAGTSSPSKSK